MLSLNRPPTLLTIDFFFQSFEHGDSLGCTCSHAYRVMRNRISQTSRTAWRHVAVDDFVAVAVLLGQFAAGGSQPAGERLFALGIPLARSRRSSSSIEPL